MASAVAYGFSRFRFPGRNALFFVVLTTLMLPWQVTIVPTFLLFCLNSSEKFTISIGLRYFMSSPITGDEPRDAILMAAALIVAAPPLVLFFVAQRFFV